MVGGILISFVMVDKGRTRRDKIDKGGIMSDKVDKDR